MDLRAWLGEAYQMCSTDEGGNVTCYATRHDVSPELPQSDLYVPEPAPAQPYAPAPVAPAPVPYASPAPAPYASPAPSPAPTPAPAPAPGAAPVPTIPTFAGDAGSLAPSGSYAPAPAPAASNGASMLLLAIGALSLLS